MILFLKARLSDKALLFHFYDHKSWKSQMIAWFVRMNWNHDLWIFEFLSISLIVREFEIA